MRAVVLFLSLVFTALPSLPAASQEAAAGLVVSHVAGADGAGPGTMVQVSPSDVLVDGSTALVADASWGVLREVDLISGVTRVVRERAELPGPLLATYYGLNPHEMGLARAPGGGLYISQRTQHRVVHLASDGSSRVVAGDGRRGFLGDGGPATAASLDEPTGLAVLPDGSLLIADTGNSVVRRVAPDGSISTFAGSSAPPDSCQSYGDAAGSECERRGYGGDGGSAIQALLDRPTRVRVLRDGTVLIGAFQAFDPAPLRAVGLDGKITTLVGGGPVDPRGGAIERCDLPLRANERRMGVADAAEQPDGRLVVAVEACLGLYDRRDGTLRLLPGGTLPVDMTVAVSSVGAVVPQLYAGSMRLVDSVGRGRQLTGAEHSADPVAPPASTTWDGAPARWTQLPRTSGLATGPDGSIVLADPSTGALRTVGRDGGLRTLAGGMGRSTVREPTPARQALLTGPSAVAAGRDGSLVFADGDAAVLRLRTDGLIEPVAGGAHECKEDMGEGDLATTVELYGLADVAQGPDGTIWTVEGISGQLRRITPDGRIFVVAGARSRPCDVSSWSPPGSPYTYATGVAVAPDGTVWVAGTFCLYRQTTSGPECAVPLTHAPFEESDLAARTGGYPSAARSDVAVTAGGAVVFTDPWASVVRRLEPDGRVSTVAGDGRRRCTGRADVPVEQASFAIPTLLTVADDGALVVADGACRTLHRIGAPGRVDLRRAAGQDRLSTSAQASRDLFEDQAARSVVLARADDFADALSGTPLAAAGGGPLLLTPSGSLAAWAESELRRVLPRGGTVHLLGGERALSRAVDDRVRALGYRTVRLAGTERYDTAVKVAEQGLGRPSTVLLTTGLSAADALSAAAAASRVGGAVLLTAGNRPSAATSAYLQTNPGSRVAVGGPAATAVPSAEAVVGENRYATAVAVAERFFEGPHAAVLASGTGFADALSGGAVAAARQAPLLLTDPARLPASVEAWLAARSGGALDLLVVGGSAAVSPAVAGAARAAVR